MLCLTNIGNIGDPFGVRDRDREIPLKVIPGSTGTSPRRLPPPPLLRHALEPRSPYQLRHSVASASLPGIAQILPDPRTSHHAVLIGMKFTNLGE